MRIKKKAIKMIMIKRRRNLALRGIFQMNLSMAVFSISRKT